MIGFLDVWAALGLLFIGVKMLGNHVQELAGGRLRERISKALDRPLAVIILGVLCGAVTQSSAAVAVAASGLLPRSGAQLTRVMPLLPWGNVGTSALLLLLALNLHAAIFFVLGLVGVGLLARIDRREWVRHVLGALLGLSLLLWSSEMLRTTARKLGDEPSVNQAINWIAHEGPLGVAFGLLLGALTQSSLTPTIMALPLLQAGLLHLHDVAPILIGAFIGTGVGQWLVLSSGAGIEVRRLMLGNLILRALVGLILLAVIKIELVGGGVGLLSLLMQRVTDPGTQLSLFYFAVQLSLAVACELLKVPVAAWVRHLLPTPPAVVKPWTEPVHLFDGGIGVADTALEVSRLELLRLFRALPACLDDLRPATERATDGMSFAQRLEGSDQVERRVSDYLYLTIRAHPGMAGMDRLFVLQRQAAALRSCNRLIEQFVEHVSAVPEAERPPVIGHMVEALHAMLETAADALGAPNDEQATQILRDLTSDRSPSLDRVRKTLMNAAQTFHGRESLLNATLEFERLLWVLNHLPVSPIGGDLAA